MKEKEAHDKAIAEMRERQSTPRRTKALILRERLARKMRRDIPYIDPCVKYIRFAALRKLTKSALLAVKGLLVIEDRSGPIAVIVPYDEYLQIQKAIIASAEEPLDYMATTPKRESIARLLKDVDITA